MPDNSKRNKYNQMQRPRGGIHKHSSQHQPLVTKPAPASSVKQYSGNQRIGQAPVHSRQMPAHPQGHSQAQQGSKDTLLVFEDGKLENLGLIGEGTYGEVYLGRYTAQKRDEVVAVKSLKPIKECPGVAPTAVREVAVLRELNNIHVIRLLDVYVNPTHLALSLIFEYAEFDLSKILQYHVRALGGKSLSPYTIKSILYHLLSGLAYLHQNWILHRDLKPSNLLIMGDPPHLGCLRIGDFGLARVVRAPLQALDKNGVVVTMWYRPPELLLGSRHYTAAVDMWAVGCIFAELAMLKVLFQGTETKGLIQKAQLLTIFSVLGSPSSHTWPSLEAHPYWANNVQNLRKEIEALPTTNRLEEHVKESWKVDIGKEGLDLMSQLLSVDPAQRLTAEKALQHPYFKQAPQPGPSIFSPNGDAMPIQYPRHPRRQQKR